MKPYKLTLFNGVTCDAAMLVLQGRYGTYAAIDVTAYAEHEIDNIGCFEVLPDGTCDGKGNEPACAIVTFKYTGTEEDAEFDIDQFYPVDIHQLMSHKNGGFELWVETGETGL